MSHDYLHGSHAGLPGWIRVKNILTRGVGAGGLVDSTTVAGLLKKGSGTVV